MSPLVADGVALGHVILGYSKVSFVPRFVGLVKRAALVTVLVLLIIAPISWIWASRTGEPLLRLAEAMRRVPGELEESRLTDLPKSGDEIGQLADAYQRMVGELKNKQELERQMLVSERLGCRRPSDRRHCPRDQQSAGRHADRDQHLSASWQRQ